MYNYLVTIFKYTFFFLFTSFFIFLTPKITSAESWQYPLDRTLERTSYKTFGQYFDKNSYIRKEALFPNQYTGFHAGFDLEIFIEEKDANVPVYAVGNGTISYIGPVTGYGGLILEKFDNLDLTALYGHLKLSTDLKAGNKVQTGQIIATLGKEFSSETGEERKHLHFAIYKGNDLYFKGYENTKVLLDQKWIDPMQFLSDKTIIVTSTPTLTPTESIQIIKSPQKLNFLQTFLSWIRNILKI